MTADEPAPARRPAPGSARHRAPARSPVRALGTLPAAPPTRRPREPFPWLWALVTVALLAGSALTIVYGVAPVTPAAVTPAPPMAPGPVTAPLEPVTPTPRVPIVLGRRANVGSDCDDPNIPGIDSNGNGTVCRPGPDGLRWVRGTR